MQHVDILIIGSGIAGLTYALKTANHFPDKSILICTKADELESNTKYAQGGIATVMDLKNDSFEQHIIDTLIAGDGHCDPEIVSMVVREAPARIQELIEWGTRFDRNTKGNYDYGLEGGHSHERILHYKDFTGLEVEQKLLKQIHSKTNITLLTNHLALDLITTPMTKQCKGAYILNRAENKVIPFNAKVTMLATGGIGQTYLYTTNPTIATGDGIAMAYRAKATIKDMQFVQFHPTALFYSGFKPAFLISEAVRGFGGILRNKEGVAFMSKYDTRKELAPRDIVTRAIHTEMQEPKAECVYLDTTHIDAYEFKKHFPVITETLNGIGINPQEHLIPVIPAAHYVCGGISVNQNGETSIANLLACGECAATGLHGANRLASNSLLEALVFAHRSYLKTIELLKKTVPSAINYTYTQQKKVKNVSEELDVVKLEIQQLMSTEVSIIRSNKSLEKAENRLLYLQRVIDLFDKSYQTTPQMVEIKNLITIALLITKQSIKQKENKGAYYNMNLSLS
ncbi:L-aspartate oxidase [Neptunitalea chrysea]|uniref:L-aspartate oxidase n=1 Tax=Neptunitalea chrysea TaxID=1647581 RepID=A0A9W6ETA3_9FLAO|nr:L-aspartate oxidase [Neptunitalea chrysea]GLB51500.1 L-aspartate oxidase [Neptunitalea chrysea]